MTSGNNKEIVDRVEKLAKHLLANSLRLDPDFSKFAGMDWMEAFFEEVLPILGDRKSWIDLIKITAPSPTKDSLVIRLMEIFPIPRNHPRDTRSLREFHYFVVARHALLIEVMADAILRVQADQLDDLKEGQKQSVKTMSAGRFEILNVAFRMVRSRNGHDFNLGSKQAEFIQLLWEQNKSGTPWVDRAAIIDKLFSEYKSEVKIPHILRNKKDTSGKYHAWDELVESRSGLYRLKV
jgi:hypothetical protein